MNDDKVSKTKETDLQKFVRSLLDPEGFGHTVSAEVRDEARHALGIPKSETIANK
jgi:hypothetical protein